jgi:hypothetical protein
MKTSPEYATVRLRRSQTMVERGHNRAATNANWRGGGFDCRNRPATHHLWSRLVRQRDGYTCQQCGTTTGRLCAHHIKSWRHHPASRYDLDNGITLCPRCHGLAEQVTRD